MKFNAYKLSMVGALLVVAAGLSPSIGTVAQASTTSAPQQRGINTYFTYNCQSASIIAKWAHTEFSQYKALGANTVAITFPLYTDNITSNKVYGRDVCNNPNYQTPSVGILGTVISVAKSLGLKVFERPAINSANLVKQNPTYWAGDIKPNNVNLWFTNYVATLKPYLVQAQQLKVDSLAISSELDSMSLKTQWKATIATFHKEYAGKMVFNFSWNSSGGKAYWAGTSTGIDAYPSIPSAADNSSPAALLALWNQLLASSPKYKLTSVSTITIDEIGLPAQDRVFSYPWVSNFSLVTHPFNAVNQANWFTAACNFAKTHQMPGIYYWGPWLGNRSGAMLKVNDPKHSSDIQPLTQQAIKACFTS